MVNRDSWPFVCSICSETLAREDKPGQVVLRLGSVIETSESLVCSSTWLSSSSAASGKMAMNALGVVSSAIEGATRGEVGKLGIDGLLVRPLRCEGVRKRLGGRDFSLRGLGARLARRLRLAVSS